MDNSQDQTSQYQDDSILRLNTEQIAERIQRQEEEDKN